MGNQLRILIVEDSEIDANLIVRHIRKLGFDVAFERVDTPEAMRVLLDKKEWDAILSDYSMPGFNALGALGVLKSSGLDLPFIIVSGVIGEEAAVTAMKAGVHDYIKKDNLVRLVPVIEREIIEAKNRRARRDADQALQAAYAAATYARQQAEGLAVDNARLYQQAQEAIGLRDEFLAIASHELKTPITSMKLHNQLVLRALRSNPEGGADRERMVKLIEMSAMQIDKLSGLIDELLDVSRIQAGKLIIRFENVRLSDVVRDVCERFQTAVNDAKCSFEYDLDPEVTGYWDHFRIEQVVVNLISNAIKYAPGKPIKITVKGNAHSAILMIQDFGPGIPQDKQSVIFDRFERATSESGVSGLGLGLFIVAQIAKAHGGEVRLKSDAGKGCTFIVELPRKINAMQRTG
jgi:signal transduction histidine kinase